MQNVLVSSAETLPPPLRVRPDMNPQWLDIEESFDTAADRIIRAHAADGAAHDLPVLDLRHYAVVPQQGIFALAPVGRHREPMPLRNNAFTNVMARLGAPAEFVRDRLPAPLQLAVTNYLMCSSDDALSATLRLRGNDVSAVVSHRYAPLDPIDLIESVRSVLQKTGMLNSVAVRSTATGLVDALRLVIPSEKQAVKVGDISALGIDITNSSFGRSSLKVTGIVWRLRCTNGLRAAERQGSFSVRHVGESQRLRDGLAEAIPNAIAQARGLMSRWKLAVHTMIDDVQQQVESIRELTIPEQKQTLDELKTELGVRELPRFVDLYSLTNGITAAARQAVPARRLEMETLAGELLARRVGGAS
jgi:hypothetical protein